MHPRSPLLEIAEHVRACLNADACAVYEASTERASFRLVASCGGDADSCPLFELLPSAGPNWHGFTSFSAYTGQSLRIQDVSQPLSIHVGGVAYVVTWDDVSCELDDPGAMLAEPIRRGDEIVGVVRVVRRRGAAEFRDADVESLRKDLAPMIGISFDQEKGRSALVAGLLEVARLYTPSEGPPQEQPFDAGAILETIWGQAESLVRSSRHGAAVFMEDGEGGFVFRAPRQIEQLLDTRRYEKSGRGLTPAVLRGEVPFVLTGNLPMDTAPGGRLAHLGHQPKRGEIPGGQTMSFMAVPIFDTLIGDNKIIGCIRVSSEQKYAFSHRDVETLRALADQTTHILQVLRRLREREVLFGTLVDTLQSAIMAVDNRGVVTVCNAEAQRMLGLDESPVGRSVVDVAYGGRKELARATRRAIGKADARQRVLDHHTVCYRSCSGSDARLPIPVRLQAKFLRAPDSGRVTGTIGILHDVASEHRSDRPYAIGTSGLTADTRVIHDLQKVLRSRATDSIMVLGENGTGKGLVVEHINATLWPDRKLHTLSCAGLVDSLLETTLFGVERGAFTDARQTKPGLFHSGAPISVFLDDLQDMPVASQGKLLRVVQDNKIMKVGSIVEETIDAKLFVATWQDLKEAVEREDFRRDLYHRLEGVRLRLPPLRERRADIMLLADHFLSASCVRHQVSLAGFESDVIRAFLAYHWPGNVRELMRSIDTAVWEYAARQATDPLLGLACFSPQIADALEGLADDRGADADSAVSDAVPAGSVVATVMHPLPPPAFVNALDRALWWDCNDPAFRQQVRDKESLARVMDHRGVKVGRSQLYVIWNRIAKQRADVPGSAGR